MDITSIGELLIDLTSAGVNENGVALYAALGPWGLLAGAIAAAAEEREGENEELGMRN